MSTQLISSFQNATDNTIQMLLSNAVRQKDVDVICVWKYSRTTVDMPVYAFITPDELVLVLIDWREQPYQEVLRGDITLAMPFLPENRVNPVSRLSEFMSQYMKAMQAADIRLKRCGAFSFPIPTSATTAIWLKSGKRNISPSSTMFRRRNLPS